MENFCEYCVLSLLRHFGAGQFLIASLYVTWGRGHMLLPDTMYVGLP